MIKHGNITIWFSKDVKKDWFAKPSGVRGFQLTYSDRAIEMISVIRFRFSLSLRVAQGFTASLLKLMSINLPVPHYSTLSRRLEKSSIDLGKMKSKKPIHIVMDSNLSL